MEEYPRGDGCCGVTGEGARHREMEKYYLMWRSPLKKKKKDEKKKEENKKKMRAQRM